MPEEHATSYRAARGRIGELVRAAGPAACDAPAPATPEWRVRDVVAHLVGVSDDAVSGNMEGIASEPWTAAQVEKRRAVPVDDLLREWEEHCAVFDAAVAALPEEVVGQLLFDTFTHEHDIRHALGAPGARDSDALGLSWAWVVGARTRGGGPALRCITEAGDDVAGAGDVLATVRGSRFELLRAMSGRRSTSEIAGYGWDPRPDTALLLAGPIFSVRAEPLGE